MIIVKKLLSGLIISVMLLSINVAAQQELAGDNEPDTNILESLMPTYGNWCGANHPVDINNAEEPINSVDRACMIHDFCYQEQGYFDCGCDQAINEELIVGLREH